MAMAAAPLIRVLGGLGIRVAAVHVIDTYLMCGSLEQLGPSDPKKEDKDQQQQDDGGQQGQGLQYGQRLLCKRR